MVHGARKLTIYSRPPGLGDLGSVSLGDELGSDAHVVRGRAVLEKGAEL